MKIHLKKIAIAALVVFAVSEAYAYQSTNSVPMGQGNWHTNSNWVNNDKPPVLIGNAGSFKKFLTVNVNDSIWLGNQQEIEKLNIENNNFVINVHGQLTIGDLESKNAIIINISEEGRFTIFKNLTTYNTITINVAEGGILDIRDSLVLKNNAGIVIDGEFSANVIYGGNNNGLTGSGIMYLPHPNSVSGLNLNSFNGVIVYGNTNLDLPAPFDFVGEEQLGARFWMQWKLIYSVNDDYQLIGFQLLKNNDPNTPFYEAHVIEIIDEHEVHLTTDASELFFTDEDLNPGDSPRYYVRAVYLMDGEITFSGIAGPVGPPTPLPISLVFFQASSLIDGVEISWTTATETNNLGFEIQRLDEGMGVWQPIGFVEGNYNHNGLLHYSFLDQLPMDGVNYYRLKQMDFDGAFEFFGPVAAYFGEEGGNMKINVVKNQSGLFIVTPGQEAGMLEIFDLQGRLILSQYANGQVSLPLAKGSYIARFSNRVGVVSAKFAF